MIWRAFRRSSASGPDSSASESEAWWRDADRVASAPDADAIAALAARITSLPTVADDAERESEMIEGLQLVRSIAVNQSLPEVTTQHRVIGTDVCHFVAPVTLPAHAGTPGKLFLTSARVVLAGGKTIAWPWHRIRRFTRMGRSLTVIASGSAEPLEMICNTYGDALVAAHLASRLMPPSALK